MGMSGAGKSEFINYIAGEARVTQVGDDYKPCTTKVLPLVIKPSLGNGRRLVLVDTPGYGDNVGNDAKIQNCIISGLKKLYVFRSKRGGNNTHLTPGAKTSQTTLVSSTFTIYH